MTRILEDIRDPQKPPKEERPPRARNKSQAREEADDAPIAQIPLTADEKKLASSIAQAYGMIGVGIVGIGIRLSDQGLVGTGVETSNMAEALSLAWIELARKNPKIKTYLKKMVEASAAGVLIGMHVAVLMPLLADRGIIPVGMVMASEADETATGGNGHVPG
jgi:hypothetical protein